MIVFGSRAAKHHIIFPEVDQVGEQNCRGRHDEKTRFIGFVQVQSRSRAHEMVNDDQRASSAAADDIEIVECSGVFRPGSKILGGFAVPVASDRHSTHIVTTFLGHDHVQHVVGNIAKAQYRVSAHLF